MIRFTMSPTFAARGESPNGIRPAMHPRWLRCSFLEYAPDILGRRALPTGRLAGLGARRAFHHELPGRLMAVTLFAMALLAAPSASLAQNQTPPRPAQPGQPAAPANQTPDKPAGPPPPAAVPIYISPAAVQHIQQQLLSLGFPVPAVNGGWGDNTAAAVALFQQSKGLDGGGDLDELTLAAMGLSQLLNGELPAGAKPVASLGAAGNGAPVSVSPRTARIVQNKLTEAGFPTDNLFGIWMAGSESAARAYQKSKSFDQTGALDLRLMHSLGLTQALLEPKPGKSPYDSVAQILSEKAVPFTGVPLSLSPAGVRQVQLALQQKGHREVVPDGKWTEQSSAAMKKFQESQGLEATGTLSLPALRALGFNRPLADLDQAATAK